MKFIHNFQFFFFASSLALAPSFTRGFLMRKGANTETMPSALMMGKMMEHAPSKSCTPTRRLFGVGNGLSSLPIPYKATMKKWATRTKGRGLMPPSKLMGPLEYMPPNDR